MFHSEGEQEREDEYHKRIGRGCQDGVDSDSDPEWEKMQISKAINNQQVGSAQRKSIFRHFVFLNPCGKEGILPHIVILIEDFEGILILF